MGQAGLACSHCYVLCQDHPWKQGRRGELSASSCVLGTGNGAEPLRSMWHPHGTIRFGGQSSGLNVPQRCLSLSPNQGPHFHQAFLLGLKFEEKGRREGCLVLPRGRSTFWHESTRWCSGRKAPCAASGELQAELSSISPLSLCVSLLLKCDKMTGPPKFLPFLQAKESQRNNKCL